MNAPPTSSRWYPRVLLVLVAAAAVCVLAGGVWLYRTQEREMLLACQNQLTAIAQLKVTQIADWRATQIDLTRLIAEGPLTTEAVLRLLATGDSATSAQIRARFRQYHQHFGFREIILSDTAGRVCLRLTGGTAPLAPDMLALLDTVAASRQPVITDLHPGTRDNRAHIDAIAPLIRPGGGVAGFISVRTDADSFLYPAIQGWPVPSRTAETLLVRRDGNDALFLNELRHQPGSALNLRIPLTRTDVPAVQAVLGAEGVFAGTDYRGVRVLSVLKQVPGAPWYLVAKIDEDEALADWHQAQGFIVSVIIGLLAVVLVGGALLWQYHRKAHYRALYLAEAERARTARELAAANQQLQANEQQLKASNQQLQASEQQLKASNQQLQASEQQLKALNQQLTATVSALRRSEQRLTEAQRQAQIGNWELDLRQNKLYWSEEIFRLFNIDPDKFGASYEAFLAAIHPEDREAVNAAYTSSLRDRTPYRICHRLLMPDGRVKYVQEHGETEFAPDGTPLITRGTVQDITEHEMAQAELDRQHRLLNTLLANLTIGVFMVEAPTGRPLVANEAAKQLLGRGILPDANRHNLGEVYQACRAGSGEPYPLEDMPVLRAMRGESHHVDDMVVTRPDGTHTLLEVHGSPVRDPAGTVVASLVSFMDITDRKRVERELREKNAELERFTYTVSHDLKSPLTTIKGFAEAIRMDLARPRFDRAASDLKRIETAADRMALLINDLLELSRLGRVARHRERVEFALLVQEAQAMLLRAITERQAQVVIADDLPAVLVDRPRVVCVLQNLLENALKYMGDQPGPHIDIGVRGAGADRAFFVRDNGIGIDPRHHERIFGLFDKLDPGSSGTGVGLTLVRRIIEAHGGRVWVESAGPGSGCTFYFTLPEIAMPAGRS